MTTDLRRELELLEMEHKSVSLREGVQEGERGSATARSLFKNESNRGRLTHFLQWLLTPEAAHGGGETFLDEFLSFCAIDEIDIVSIDARSGEDRSERTTKTNPDLVLVGRDACLGVVLQQTPAHLSERYEALDRDFQNLEYHELVYVRAGSDDALEPDGNSSTIGLDDLLDRFESQLETVPETDTRQIVYDFITTVRRCL